jgi:hypothetical protein
MLKQSYARGCRDALEKLALSPPTQVDDFVANVESGKDVPPDPSAMRPPAPDMGAGTPPEAGEDVSGLPPETGAPAQELPPELLAALAQHLQGDTASQE